MIVQARILYLSSRAERGISFWPKRTKNASSVALRSERFHRSSGSGFLPVMSRAERSKVMYNQAHCIITSTRF
jgi:hypothetical protein